MWKAQSEIDEEAADWADWRASLDAIAIENVPGRMIVMSYDDHAGAPSRSVRVDDVRKGPRDGYIFGWCELHQSDRTFAISRINDVRDGAERYEHGWQWLSANATLESF